MKLVRNIILANIALFQDYKKKMQNGYQKMQYYNFIFIFINKKNLIYMW